MAKLNQIHSTTITNPLAIGQVLKDAWAKPVSEKIWAIGCGHQCYTLQQYCQSLEGWLFFDRYNYVSTSFASDVTLLFIFLFRNKMLPSYCLTPPKR